MGRAARVLERSVASVKVCAAEIQDRNIHHTLFTGWARHRLHANVKVSFAQSETRASTRQKFGPPTCDTSCKIGKYGASPVNRESNPHTHRGTEDYGNRLGADILANN